MLHGYYVNHKIISCNRIRFSKHHINEQKLQILVVPQIKLIESEIIFLRS